MVSTNTYTRRRPYAYGSADRGWCPCRVSGVPIAEGRSVWLVCQRKEYAAERCGSSGGVCSASGIAAYDQRVKDAYGGTLGNGRGYCPRPHARGQHAGNR